MGHGRANRSMGGSDKQWAAPSLEELISDFSREEQLRLQNQFRERERRWKRHSRTV
ncbi:hypothetical protein ACP70R_044704 [Stipagrostis hirtigluma subsp. patula]